jgi:hypothetical protein
MESNEMTDRELLELAAKAAKLPFEWNHKYEVPTLGKLEGSIFGYKHWNPLTDDGDALRLAVKLANTNDNFHSITWNWTHREIRVFADAAEGYGDDPCAATRRAIVRAAAEIGKAMK